MSTNPGYFLLLCLNKKLWFLDIISDELQVQIPPGKNFQKYTVLKIWMAVEIGKCGLLLYLL